MAMLNPLAAVQAQLSDEIPICPVAQIQGGSLYHPNHVQSPSHVIQSNPSETVDDANPEVSEVDCSPPFIYHHLSKYHQEK